MGLETISSRTGFLLAGGKSSRMGTDKAFLQFRGKPLLENTLAVMRRACSSVTIVGDPAEFGAYGGVVADVFAGCGPLAGIHAGLKSSSSELNFFLAVDMPYVSAELIALLLGVAAQSDAVVVVPRTTRGLQPLCAVYRRSFAAVAEGALRARKYKVDAAFAGLPIRVVDEAELVRHGFSEHDFFNVNTPEDLRLAEDSTKRP
jgi:molybdopterin-guanine dinucleotide biosynthesis protein A